MRCDFLLRSVIPDIPQLIHLVNTVYFICYDFDCVNVENFQ